MRAVVITGHGGPEVLQVQDREEPRVGPGEVRVTVRAAGVNFADLMARTGVYPDAPKPPSVVGYEVAGEVESVGDGVEGISVGDRVVAGTRFGGYAEMVTVPAGQVIPLPEGLSFEQGAAIPVNYGTAYAALIVMAGLKPAERVLIHAAAGGVGIAATQIACKAGGEIFGTASESKHDAIREQGVSHPIDYRTQDFAAEVERITRGEGLDVIIDATGPTNFRKDYRLLRAGGRLVMFGLAEAQTGDRRNLRKVIGAVARTPFSTMPWWTGPNVMNENKGVFGLNMLKWWDREQSLDRLLDPLTDGLASGDYTPVVAEAFPFDGAPDAHRFLQDRKNIGKVVLTP